MRGNVLACSNLIVRPPENRTFRTIKYTVQITRYTVDASRGGIARWKGWKRWLSARVTVERGVVRFWLDYACAHIIILAGISSVNLQPIRADFVAERDIENMA